MAGFAFHIELGRLQASVLVSVVTAETGHFAVGEAFAGRQSAVLIAVDVDPCSGITGIGPEKVEQLVPGLEAKGGLSVGKCPAVTKPAEVKALLTGGFCRVKNGMACLFTRILVMEGDVFEC